MENLKENFRESYVKKVEYYWGGCSRLSLLDIFSLLRRKVPEMKRKERSASLV